jgi:hypothetical protein
MLYFPSCLCDFVPSCSVFCRLRLFILNTKTQRHKDTKAINVLIQKNHSITNIFSKKHLDCLFFHYLCNLKLKTHNLKT